VLKKCHLKFYKSSWNFDSNTTTYKEFFGCSKTYFYSVQWFFFKKFLTPSTLGGHNFFDSNLFLAIFSVLDAPIRGVQVFFKH
jgi:hypothetical protein